MRVILKVLRGEAAWRSHWFSLVPAKCVLLQSRFRAALRLEAIAVPRIFGAAESALGISNNSGNCARNSRRKTPLVSFCLALFFVTSYVANAQTATTTILSVNPASAANGSVITMTATVKAGATQMSGGTVTFRDTYNSITQVMGTVQVQSANGTKGNAVLLHQLGGIGTHS